MIMLTDITDSNIAFNELSDKLEARAEISGFMLRYSTKTFSTPCTGF
jgi:hypothetical protein